MNTMKNLGDPDRLIALWFFEQQCKRDFPDIDRIRDGGTCNDVQSESVEKHRPPKCCTQSHPLLGTWKLISVIAIFPDGSIDREAYGPNPKGYITYTPEGRMMVLFARSDRQLFSEEIRVPLGEDMDSVSLEERAQAFSTFNAYAGTYTINGNTVTHRVEVASIPNRVGKDLVRTFTFSGNRVTLKTEQSVSDNTSKVLELVWERVEH